MNMSTEPNYHSIEHQVKVLQGYKDGLEVEQREIGTIDWEPKLPRIPFNFIDNDYRLKPKNHKKKISWTQADVPAVCWLHSANTVDFSPSFLVQHINQAGVFVSIRDSIIEWNELEEYWMYSTDLKEWNPCCKYLSLPNKCDF